VSNPAVNADPPSPALPALPQDAVRKSQLVPGATPAELYAIVTDFAAYPRLFKEIKSAVVLARDGQRHRVEFRAEAVVAVRYVLDLRCDPGAHTVDWSYVEGEVVTDSVGAWRFVPEAGGTRLDYATKVTIKAPLPGFVLRRVTDALVSVSLPAMFAAIASEHAARRRSGSPG
jgi:ribosome-associated toxin RatA of RatAB toxin-antitoxin module